MNLTANERSALAQFAKRRVDWSFVHGRTLHALQRKGLVAAGNGWHLTDTGRAELDKEVKPKKRRKPAPFADSFTTREASIAIAVEVPWGDCEEAIAISIDCQGKITGDEDTIDLVIGMLERAKANLIARRP